MFRLIVLDDEKIIRESIISFDWESIGIEPAACFSCGEEALAYMQEHSVDVVLTDICMPGMDGVSVIAQIKKLNPDIVVICISGYDEYEYLRACLKLGANDYLLKPIDKKELFDTVSYALAGKSSDKEKDLLEETITGEQKTQNYYVDMIVRYVGENYKNHISLEKIAEVVCLNPVYLSHLFKKMKKVNFSEYLNDVRIKKAEELLKSTTLRISEISEHVGYNDTKYFSSLFKKKTGMSPNEYRNKT